MRKYILILFAGGSFSLAAQTHTSVPLDDGIYYVLEQAQIRGLCPQLPKAKPYSRKTILTAIEEILGQDETGRFGTLTEAERRILEQTRKKLIPSAGLDWSRGEYYFEHTWDWIRFSAHAGISGEVNLSGGVYPGSEQNAAGGTDSGLTGFLKGDIGRSLSYGLTLSGWLLLAPRRYLGTYDTYYPGYVDDDDPTSYINQQIDVYSEPRSYFPYTYKKRWDGFVTSFASSNGMDPFPWPDEISGGYSILPELAGSLFNNHLTWRFARLDREWGGMAKGSSLVLNQSARPFVALETTVQPFRWFIFSSLTGVLEFYNEKSIQDSARSSQNAFSLAMLEFNYKNYAHLDFGSSALWPKRFELGYMFPLADNFFYQNNIGDFDNMGLFFNLKGQYPGVGNLWFSFFLDEINIEKNIFVLDRGMYALQIGGSLAIPIWSFTSVTVSYTKIEPYCYTHMRVFVPWYGNTPMETAYINNGVSLGSYLPPNSDELLLRFETIPALHTKIRVQYQMIRQGATFGSGAVDGSSIRSELDPSGRSTKDVLRKYFLQDGAYQWMHIFKVGGEYGLARHNLPVTLFAEAGFVIAYFTNIKGPPNSGSPSDYSIVNTAEYPRSFGFIGSLGVRIFPH